jgi:predicted membrane protein
MRSILIISEKKIVAVCLTLGCFVSALLAPKDAYFLPNFLIFWGSQIVVLLVSLVVRPRAAVVAGTAFSLAVYLGLFGLWVNEAMAWLGYLFSLPGALFGALLAGGMERNRWSFDLDPLKVSLLAAAWVAAGIAINQALIYVLWW